MAVDGFMWALRCACWAALVAGGIFVAIGLAASQIEYVRSGRRAAVRAETREMRGRVAQHRSRVQ